MTSKSPANFSSNEVERMNERLDVEAINNLTHVTKKLLALIPKASEKEKQAAETALEDAAKAVLARPGALLLWIWKLEEEVENGSMSKT